MKIINFYILRQHFGPFLFGTVLVVFLFLFQFLMRDLDKLVGKGLSIWVILHLITLNLSWMIVLAIPMGVLFSTLMTFGNMSANYEITALKSGGASFFQMFSSVLIFSFLLFLFLLWFNDRVLPESNHQAKILMMDINRKKPTFALEAGQFSTLIENYTILARWVDSISNSITGINIYDLSDSYKTSTISADSGFVLFLPNISKFLFTLYKGEVLQVVPYDLHNYKKIKFERLELMLDARGFLLERSNEAMVSRSDREMSIQDMQEIVNAARNAARETEKKLEKIVTTPALAIVKTDNLDSATIDGLKDLVSRDISYLETQLTSESYRMFDLETRARQYEVEIHKKYAIPFACIVFTLVGCPLGMLTRRGNFGIAAAISIGFYIFYWACLIGGEKLADRGYISSFWSMWIGNFLILIFSIYLIIRVNYEVFSREIIFSIFRRQ
ncbi:MAG: LptF/LptG family permease [Ignavibacteria bacterium]|nr:LptF/LptG family permease [Ignavibacteria bacterium]